MSRSIQKIAIVYHSGYGHTQRQAEAVAAGARQVAGAQVALIPVAEAEARIEELNAADAIIFGAPTYLGSASAAFKGFMEYSSKIWFAQGWKDKLAAGFTNSASINGDKATTLQALFTLAQQHGMLWVGTGMLPANSKASTRDDINHLAGFSGLVTATPADAGVDEMVPGDLATARAFGERVAGVVRRTN